MILHDVAGDLLPVISRGCYYSGDRGQPGVLANGTINGKRSVLRGLSVLFYSKTYGKRSV